MKTENYFEFHKFVITNKVFLVCLLVRAKISSTNN